MKFRRSLRASPRTSDSGFTLIELLVGLVLSGLLLGIVARDFAAATRARSDIELLMETQQGVRAAVGALTQEVRQAGACLPRSGVFLAMEGEDEGTTDTLTIRTGRVDPETLTCVQAVVLEDAESGDTKIVVDNTDGFEEEQLVYIVAVSGNTEAFHIGQVNGKSQLTLDTALPEDLVKGAGVYAVETRTYSIETIEEVGSRMTVAIDDEEPQPLVQGAEEFDIEYRLAPCPPCDAVDLPLDEAEWYQVREIAFTVTVRSIKPNRQGEYLLLTGKSTVKPRNFL